MNLTALLKEQKDKSGELPNNVNKIVVGALIHVVENYFLHLAPYFVLTLSCEIAFYCKYYNDLLEKLFRTWESPPMQIVNISPYMNQYIPGSRDLNLILVDSFEAFRAINVISYTAYYNHNEYYFIYLQNTDKSSRKEMTKIFDYCWANHIINCNVQIQTSQGRILIFTYYPFTSERCGKATIQLINEFKNGTLVNSTLFPKKLLNFYRCPLRAAMWDVPPYVYMKEFKNGSGLLEHGIEVRLVKMLAERLNFSIEVKVPVNREQRGEAYGDIMTDALLMLQQRTADFAVGCFRFALDRAQVTTPTSSYHQTSLVVCTPVSAYTFSSLQVLLFPFAASTWILLLFIWTCALFLIWLGGKFRRFHPNQIPLFVRPHTYLNVLLMAIGMPSTQMPSHFFSRLLCVTWIIFTLLMRTAYQALLYHFVRTHPTNPFPNTMDDLVDQNYTVVMSFSALNSLRDVQFISDLHLSVFSDDDETVAFQYIEEYPRKTLAATGPLDLLAYYIIKNRKGGVFRLLEQNIFTVPITMYLTKHSYLRDQFDKELTNFQSMGFIQVWTLQELDFEYLKDRNVDKEEIFGLKDLYMLFVLGFIGMTIATIVFLLEILSKRIELLKNIFAKI